MPGFDGTGPRGMGPMTGGGRGFCGPYAVGSGYGLGRGYGFERGYGFGMGMPYGYPYGGMPYARPAPYAYGGAPVGCGFGRGRGWRGWGGYYGYHWW